MSVSVATIALALTCSPARAQYGAATRPFEHTDFSVDAQTRTDQWWARVFSTELEVMTHGAAFAAHFSIARPWARQEIGVYYADRLCRDVTTIADAIVSLCPAELITYPNDQPFTVQKVSDVCVARIGDKPPTPSQAGWTGPVATIRSSEGGYIFTAFVVVRGQVVPGCTATFALGSKASFKGEEQ